MPDPMGKLRQFRDRRPWLDHLIRAGGRYQDQRGDFYAAGITYYTVLALFQLLMVAFSAAGFVLAGNSDLLDQIRERITENIPGEMGSQINDLINQAISSRTGVGVIGLVGALYAGLGWMGNLRAALTEQWEQKHDDAGFAATKLSDLGALIGTALAIVVSLALSALSAGPIITRLLDLAHLGDAPGVSLLLRAASIAVSILASWALFTWVIARLPREPVTVRSAMRAGLLAAAVFEVFKQLGAFYLKSVLSSPAGVAFGPILGIMVFGFISWRILLFATAWAATAKENLALTHVPAPEPVVIRPRVEVRPAASVWAGIALFGAGALAALGLRRRRQ